MQQRVLAFRLYPSARQCAVLANQLDLTRRLYNACLEQRRTAHALHVKVPREYDQNRQLKELRAGMPEYAALPAGVLFAVPKRVQLAYENFFRGDAGFPRFRGRARFNSLTHLAPLSPHGHGTFRVEDRYLVLTKTGRIRHQVRNKPAWLTDAAVPKTCTLKLLAGRWNACVTLEVDDAAVVRPAAPFGSGVGLDAGLTHLWSDDSGGHESNPRWLQRSLRRLQRKQRSLSRRKTGSARRRRQALVVARIHERVANQRLDRYHQLTRRLASRYALVAVEDHLAGLGRGRLARNVHDAAWGTLRRLLAYKLPEHGGRLVAVDPRGTSQKCSGCGGFVEELPGRRVRCCTTPDCGLVLDRDTNAARNIVALARARESTRLENARPVPPDGREVTPGETGGRSAAANAAVEVPVEEPGTGIIPV